MAVKKILMLVGDFVEDYEAMLRRLEDRDYRTRLFGGYLGTDGSY